jgi:hypothetical protein
MLIGKRVSNDFTLQLQFCSIAEKLGYRTNDFSLIPVFLAKIRDNSEKLIPQNLERSTRYDTGA